HLISIFCQAGSSGNSADAGANHEGSWFVHGSLLDTCILPLVYNLSILYVQNLDKIPDIHKIWVFRKTKEHICKHKPIGKTSFSPLRGTCRMHLHDLSFPTGPEMQSF